MFLRYELHSRELRRPHAGCPYVADFSRFHQVMQCFHGFFDGDSGVETVDLEEVNVGCVEAGEGGFDGGEDGLAGESSLVNVIFTLYNILLIEERPHPMFLPYNPMAFRQNDELMSRDVVFLIRLSDDLLGCAVAVDIRRIPGI